jgi:restriction system protein
MVTTSRFTRDAVKYVEKEQGKGIISLIDGKKLIQQCIDLGVGFICKPIFNSNSLDELMKSEIASQGKDKSEQDKKETTNKLQTQDNKVLKSISKNDIRSKILPIPKSIYTRIPENLKSFNVVFQGTNKKNLKINRDRKYFGGVTEIYREYGLITENNVLNPIDSYWSFDSNLGQINVEFHNS